MTTVSITINGSDAINKKLRDLGSGNFAGLYARIGEVVKQQVDQRFDKQVDPSGAPWAPRKELGGLSSSGKANRILQKTNRLRLSIQYQAQSDAVLVGTNVVYAPIHQFGGVVNVAITPKMRKYFWAKYYENQNPKYKYMALTKKTSFRIQIPARAFLGINDQDKKEINQVIEDYIRERIA